MGNSNTSSQVNQSSVTRPRTLGEYNDSLISLSTLFVSRKLALAAKALMAKGVSPAQIAEDLELTSESSVRMLVSRYGGSNES